jgi:hypothetical protein
MQTPQSVRSQIEEILDQMTQFGILQNRNENSLSAENHLITKKLEGGKIRILLDTHLLPHFIPNPYSESHRAETQRTHG